MLGTGRNRTVDEMLAALEASGTQIVTVAIRRLDLDNPNEKTLLDYIDWGRFQVLPLEGELALVELHRQVIDNLLGKRSAEEALLYTRDPEEAVRWVDEGRGQQAFFLDSPDLAVVLKLAQEGRVLPQKSTFFHPKPPSGMVFHGLTRTDP